MQDAPDHGIEGNFHYFMMNCVAFPRTELD